MMRLVHRVRSLTSSELRAANDLFRRTIHQPPVTDEHWERIFPVRIPERNFGAFLDGELVGTAASSVVSLAVPGGATSAAAVTMVGVRADSTRRGALTAMMGAQLADVRDRGESAAILHASEATIYGRFGYGPATRSRVVSMDTRAAVMRADAPGGGRVRVVDSGESTKGLSELYGRIGLHRPGMISREDAWWRHVEAGYSDVFPAVAVHVGQDGVEDGFAVYQSITGDHRVGDFSCTLQVRDLQAANPAAAADLYRFLLGVDLARRVRVALRPVDEPLEWWLADRRTAEVSHLADDLWLRLVDVPAALAARTYGGTEPVVIEVRDGFLPDNSGNYRIGRDGVDRCDRPAQLALEVDALGAVYLGDVSFVTLAAANRVTVLDPAALATADQVFATPRLPWCGTGF